MKQITNEYRVTKVDTGSRKMGDTTSETVWVFAEIEEGRPALHSPYTNQPGSGLQSFGTVAFELPLREQLAVGALIEIRIREA